MFQCSVNDRHCSYFSSHPWRLQVCRRQGQLEMGTGLAGECEPLTRVSGIRLCDFEIYGRTGAARAC